MGVLDDAIREHLDLKLRRGADESEVERQAAEALGPARREPPAEPAVPVEAADDAAPSAEPPTELAEGLTPPPVAEEPPVAEAEPVAEVTPLHPIEDAATAGETFPEAPPPEPASPGPTEDPDAPAAPVDEPAEPDEVPADEQIGDKSEDDRLWFEQRPSRDFDLDE